MASELRIKPVYLLGHLHALWHTALEQQEDGDLSAWSDELIADAAGFELSKAKKFVSLLQSHGWLGYADSGGTLIPGTEKLIHNWTDYVGKFLSGRYAGGRNPDLDRLRGIWSKHLRQYGSRTSSGREVDEQRTVSTPPTHPPNPPPPTLPTKPNPPTPPHPRAHRVGIDAPRVGEGETGEGNFADEFRQAEVYALLGTIGVAEPNRVKLSQQKRITVERVREVYDEVKRSGTAANIPSCVVHRLNASNGRN